jgi:hypothetical protein
MLVCVSTLALHGDWPVAATVPGEFWKVTQSEAAMATLAR